MLWLCAFLFTQIIELPIYTFALGRGRLWRRLAIGFTASSLTHPLVWMTTGSLMQVLNGFWPAVAVTETFAVLVEAVFLKIMGLKRALLWSFVANSASFSIGLLVSEVLL